MMESDIEIEADIAKSPSQKAKEYDIEADIAKLYSENAKNYITLAIGGLALSVTFLEKVLGSKPGERPGRLLIATWIFLLGAVIFGATYQYLSVRWLEFIANRESLLFKNVHRSTFGTPLVRGCQNFCVNGIHHDQALVVTSASNGKRSS